LHAEVGALSRRASSHAFHAVDLLTHPPRFNPLSRARTRFVAAYTFGESIDALLLHVAPKSLAAEVKLALALRVVEGSLEVERAARTGAAVLEPIAEHLGALLSEVLEKPNAKVAELGAGGSSRAAQSTTTAVRDEVFAF